MRTRSFFKLSIYLLIFCCFSCTTASDLNEANGKTIYVVSQGWHTGLIVSSDCVDQAIWPEKYNYSTFDHLMIGWGDRDYYQNPSFNFWYFTKAAAWPTESVLQVTGLNSISAAKNVTDDLILLEISEEDYENLCQFISTSFKTNEQGNALAAKTGYYPHGRFFLGNQKYTAPNNSNVWTARALKKAGLDLSPYFYQTKGLLIRRIKKQGEVLK